MKKITKSLLMIAVVAVLAIGGTVAYFSDTETSTGNIFTAGAIDLKVDSTAHYNNAICTAGLWALEAGATATVPQYPVIGSVCGGTWGQTQPGVDITNEKFFDFGDIKPGDFGENTISLHVVNNDAWVCAEVSNLTNFENGVNEPEALVDTTTGVNEGELQNAMVWKVWRDDGAGGGVAGDNIQNGIEQTLAEGHPVNGVLPVYDSTTATGALIGGTTGYLGVSWSLPSATGNAVQTDSLTGDISFRVEQARNNTDFRCVPSGGEGTLTVIKHVVGGTNVAGDFTMNVTGTNVSDADFPGAESPGTTVTLDAGSYSVDETGPSGYTKGLSADCSGTIAAGESKTCTITNAYDTGKIIVNKVVNNYGVGTKAASDFQMTIDSSNVAQGVENVVPTGNHVVSEVTDPNYTTTIGGDCDSAGNVSVAKDETKTCTVTNDAMYGTIMVTKTVTNDNGGLLGVGDFILRIDGNAVTSGVAKNVAVGSHIVSEDGLYGYSATVSGDCASTGDVTVGAGENKACTINNNDIAPSIQLIKNVVGGTALPDDFDVSIDDIVRTSGASYQVLANTPHVIDEEAVISGYSFTSIAGISFKGVSCPAALGGTVTLLPGDVITCTITNTNP